MVSEARVFNSQRAGIPCRTGLVKSVSKLSVEFLRQWLLQAPNAPMRGRHVENGDD